MSRHNIWEVFVVTYRHTDGHSFDIGMPNEIFTTRNEAEAVAAEYNETAKTLTFKDRYFVQTLATRLDTIRTECQNQGMTYGRIG